MSNYVDVEAMHRPVPDFDPARDVKSDYRELPLNNQHELFNEPIVQLSDFGVAGQAYYSRPNNATGDPVPGVTSTVYVRHSIARTLATLNHLLKHDDISEVFGGAIEFWVNEGLRPVSLQKRLYDEVFPELIRQQNPDITDEEMAAKRQDLIAIPSEDPLRPSPHSTGGAIDLNLRYIASGETVDFGHGDADVSERAFPDYYDKHDEDDVARRHRRAFYAIMTGQAFGIETGFVCNPTEWWHWGRGDQLSETVRGHTEAYYSAVE